MTTQAQSSIIKKKFWKKYPGRRPNEESALVRSWLVTPWPWIQFKLSRCAFFLSYSIRNSWSKLHQRYILEQRCEALDLWEVELWWIHGGLLVHHGTRAGHPGHSLTDTLKPYGFLVWLYVVQDMANVQLIYDMGVYHRKFQDTGFREMLLN